MLPRSISRTVSRTHAFRFNRHLRTSAIYHSETEGNTHYETLDLPSNSTRAEIKKRYFELSKAHHPDRNRSDPLASNRFIKISTAYAVLGHEKHRAKYDFELARKHGSRPVGPVGGRPASGLSKRRGQFHGPPPSFFRNGGWSRFKGKSAHAGQERPDSSPGSGPGGFGAGGPTAARTDDVPHFNYGQKYRQHEEQQSRWARRAKQHRLEPDTSIIYPLIGVTTILVGVVSIAVYVTP
ncbi:DnaJ-domain-containing protein [Morchella conica CCBAS932]|uniref:DnaJ-domain-containing protein n=1 Tax=Morchella conica CCBAS932 TaxID=1392247 RepID=A0A3N4K8H8_9PEZI|nr:DnaJ-domain-containing protein [Morchella conica CCBAS932]